VRVDRSPHEHQIVESYEYSLLASCLLLVVGRFDSMMNLRAVLLTKPSFSFLSLFKAEERYLTPIRLHGPNNPARGYGRGQ
jgi:hypothetical protein